MKAPVTATIIQWFMNGSLIHKLKGHGEGSEILSNLTLTNVTQKDGGVYTCSCFYNRSIVTAGRNITCNSLSVQLDVKGNYLYVYIVS